ncbi:G/U mismatch-specific DNA glycosylase [Chondromyces apiculatus]|uniref:G:T/U mismatch-specific uracil/thymine DNA-glycosylase n=1 Tax=Chondromyces apiculatus DSM 436 TaxID=1192034 RepID=A0A017T1U6_9BACT|nr:G/U mismatch-specific DNA glycosylase [Chondromyces apiculatus]EYF03234.1 G:T/U mismatch-specific uracil/thymine DNA-glycosylase [Chondromyces apiculatus DSM 436]
MQRPTAAEIAAAHGRTIPDRIAKGLQVLFCGINPSLYSAAVSHHFARPGNRFWPALHAGGFTPRRFTPDEDLLLPSLGYGLTNVASPATATADELTPDQLREGGVILRRKLRRYAPRVLAVLGVGAYRVAFAKPRALMGRQPEPLEGVTVWILPNPSGLNAHYQPADLAARFAELKDALPTLAAPPP